MANPITPQPTHHSARSFLSLLLIPVQYSFFSLFFSLSLFFFYSFSFLSSSLLYSFCFISSFELSYLRLLNSFFFSLSFSLFFFASFRFLILPFFFFFLTSLFYPFSFTFILSSFPHPFNISHSFFFLSAFLSFLHLIVSLPFCSPVRYSNFLVFSFFFIFIIFLSLLLFPLTSISLPFFSYFLSFSFRVWFLFLPFCLSFTLNHSHESSPILFLLSFPVPPLLRSSLNLLFIKEQLLLPFLLCNKTILYVFSFQAFSGHLSLIFTFILQQWSRHFFPFLREGLFCCRQPHFAPNKHISFFLSSFPSFFHLFQSSLSFLIFYSTLSSFFLTFSFYLLFAFFLSFFLSYFIHSIFSSPSHLPLL
ncbi:unnamed protein product [Acanthosepion pharaonis]|uniref:Uncharacterized protein n=1 Tax=Acanthosepion pharaonis TaxID=158019 RepID=A0A812DQJ6_ACAPH|nr:unnamed protein product [Sepia pharaonis]